MKVYITTGGTYGTGKFNLKHSFASNSEPQFSSDYKYTKIHEISEENWEKIEYAEEEELRELSVDVDSICGWGGDIDDCRARAVEILSSSEDDMDEEEEENN